MRLTFTRDRLYWLALPGFLLMYGVGLPVGLLVAAATTSTHVDWVGGPEIGAYVAIAIGLTLFFALSLARRTEAVDQPGLNVPPVQTTPTRPRTGVRMEAEGGVISNVTISNVTGFDVAVDMSATEGGRIENVDTSEIDGPILSDDEEGSPE